MKEEVATFGGGCFWCIEAIVQQLRGVSKVVSGYAGGQVPGKPTYREVCSGLTGHAEVVQVYFDTSELNYGDLLYFFMTSHDPTQLNRQGADHGTQYRSVIFYHSEQQLQEANKVIAMLTESYTNPIVTEVSPLPEFHPAEEEHQNYYNRNSEAGYCRVVIEPKIAQLRKQYIDRLK